jgi:hypothetical protein
MGHAWAPQRPTLGFAQLRRNDHEMRYLRASTSRAERYHEDAARLTEYEPHPTLCAVMPPYPLFST